jgi:hypothetical protein
MNYRRVTFFSICFLTRIYEAQSDGPPWSRSQIDEVQAYRR